MAQSRLEKIGTIFSRVSNLIRTGAMNMNDRPIWYDVYRAFPPSIPPKFERPVPDIPIKKVFYKEDVIRAKFHRDMGRSLPAFNLMDTHYQTLTQKMIDLCKKIHKEKNMDFETTYQEAFLVIKAEVVTKQKHSVEKHSSDLASTYKTALDQKHQSEQSTITVDVKNIFQDK